MRELITALSRENLILSREANDNIMLATYFARHQIYRVSHQCEPYDVQKYTIKRHLGMRKRENQERQPPRTKIPPIDVTNWLQTLKELYAYLQYCHGHYELPLTFRLEVAMPNNGWMDSDREKDYSTVEDKIICSGKSTIVI